MADRFYFAWGITYTFMDKPFWSMIPAITSPARKGRAVFTGESCSGIGDAVPTVLTMVVVPILSGSSVIADYRIGFKYWALIIAIVFIISEVVFVLFVPERTDDAQMEAKGIADMFRSLFRNDQTMTIVVSIILVYSALNIVGNLMLYFFQYDVGNVSAYSGFVGVCFGTQVLIMLIFPLFRKFWGKAQLFMAAF
jgi:melibiose permease